MVAGREISEGIGPKACWREWKPECKLRPDKQANKIATPPSLPSTYFLALSCWAQHHHYKAFAWGDALSVGAQVCGQFVLAWRHVGCQHEAAGALSLSLSLIANPRRLEESAS